MNTQRYIIEISHDGYGTLPFSPESIALDVAKAHPNMFEPIGPFRVRAVEVTE